MDEEFDSGDDLFDDIDEAELIGSSGEVLGSKRENGEDETPREDTHQAKRQRSCAFQTPPATRGDLARRILSEKFGHENFRYEQELAIQRVLVGENTLVIFPTGAGKSLCYQVRA